MTMLLQPVTLQSPLSDVRQIGIQERKIGHYSNLQKILLVGEGDFSFSSALASAFGSAVNIIATSLDSLEEVLTKYQSAGTTLSNLIRCGARLLHNIDATKMAVHPFIKGLRFDIIVWNFPHAGFFGTAETDDRVIESHKFVLESFFSNASKLLMHKGEVHVSHQAHGPYKKWEVENLAELRGLKLKDSVPFHPSSYPGYYNRRGDGRFASNSFPLGVSRTYKFVHRWGHDDLAYAIPFRIHSAAGAKRSSLERSKKEGKKEDERQGKGKEKASRTVEKKAENGNLLNLKWRSV